MTPDLMTHWIAQHGSALMAVNFALLCGECALLMFLLFLKG
jgi:hypothetical protein